MNWKLAVGLIGALCLMAAFVMAANIQVGVDAVTYFNPEDYNNQVYWQSFSFPTPINVTGVILYEYPEGDGTGYYIILKDSAPNGTTLAITAPITVDYAGGWFSFPFTTPYVISANTTYYLEIYSTNLSMLSGMYIMGDTSNPYADGTVYHTDFSLIPVVHEDLSPNDMVMNITYDEVVTCTPSWNCSLFGDCLVNDTRHCIVAEDLNNCSINYTGNYSEFTPQACDYCTPSWLCTRHQNICPPWHTKDCMEVADANDCFPQTNLSADEFDGNFTAYDTTCGYNGSYSTTDLRDEAIDTIGSGIAEGLFWVRILVVFAIIGFVLYGGVRVGLDKLGLWKIK